MSRPCGVPYDMKCLDVVTDICFHPGMKILALNE